MSQRMDTDAVGAVTDDAMDKLYEVQQLEQSLDIFRTRLRKRNERIAELETMNREIEKDLETKEQTLQRMRVENASLRERNIEMKRVAGVMDEYSNEAARLRKTNAELQAGLTRYCENSASMKVCAGLCAEAAAVISELGGILERSEHHVHFSDKLFEWYVKEGRHNYSKLRVLDNVYHDMMYLKTELGHAQKVNGLVIQMQRPRPEDAVTIAQLTEELKVAKRVGCDALAKVAVLEDDKRKLVQRIEVYMN